MTLTSTREIGDKVWAVNKNGSGEFKIVGLAVCHYGERDGKSSRTEEAYFLEDDDGNIYDIRPAAHCFSTEKELIHYMGDKFKEAIKGK